MWRLKLKLHEEKLKHAGLAQQKVLAEQFCTVCSGLQKPVENATYQRANITSKNGIGNKGHSPGVMYEIFKVGIA